MEEKNMKRVTYLFALLLSVGIFSLTGFAQRGTTITGTALIYGSGFNTRTVTRPFTMIINRRTSPADAARYLQTLQRGGQDDLLDEIDGNDLGRFSVGGGVGVPLNAVIIDRDGGGTRIRAVFRRYIGFGELRTGYRSIDYPFGYVEIHLNPQTGSGDGTFIPAAKIRFRNARGSNGDTVEIEDFGTFPGRLMGVRMRGGQLP
jgi:hypothetical protein